MGTQSHDAAITRRKLLVRSGSGAAGLMVGGSLLAACGGGASPGGSAGGSLQSLAWGLEQKINVLDLTKPASIATFEAVSICLEGPLRLDDSGVPKPHLATGFEKADEKRYVLRLRDDVTFWNGDPMAAEDVAYSMARHLDPKIASPLSFFYGSVDSIEATGDLEVTLMLRSPDPTIPYVLALPSSYVVQAAFARAHVDDIGGPGVGTQGTGPYQLTVFAPSSKASFTRNERYWGTKPSARKLELSMVEEEQTRMLALRTKEIQGTFGVTADRYQAWKDTTKADVLAVPGTLLYMIGFNTEVAPFDDIHVRRAIAHALDRDGVTQGLFRGKARSAGAIPPPEQWPSLIDADAVDSLYASFPQYPFDLDAAARELAQSKVPDGFEVTVVYPTTTPALGKVLLILKQSLARLKITLNIKEMPGQAARERFLSHADGMVITTLGSDYPDPVNNLVFLLPSAYARPETFNVANYRNREVDDLLEQQKSLSGKDRADAIGKVLRHVAEDVPYLSVIWVDATMAVEQDLEFEGFGAWTWLQAGWPTMVTAA